MEVAVSEVLCSAVVDVQSVDVASLDDSSLHSSVVLLRRCIDQLCAVEASLLAAWDSRRVWSTDGSLSPGHRFGRETGLSVKDSKSLVSRARSLSSMPHVSEAFSSGVLSSSRVDLLVRANQSGFEEFFVRDESSLVETVSSLSFPQAVQAMKYWMQRADAGGCEDRAERLIRKRSAHAARTFEGSIDLRALLDPVDGEIFLNELQRLEDELFKSDWAEAKAVHGDETSTGHLKRTSPQRRCDALVEMAQRSASMPGGSQTPKPLITILVGEETLKNVCELASGAVVTPGVIVPWLTQADIESVIFDGRRRVMEVTRQRTFRGALRRAIEVRDRHCQHPSGCDVPASRCHVDHIEAYARSKTTSEANGQLLCAKHNRVKGVGPPL